MQAGTPWRKHAPFAVFLTALFLLAYFLDQNLHLVLPALYSARILLQLALAATVIAILRNVVGIKAFGTFAPVIVALSLLYTGLVLGLLLFGVVLGVMILTRGALQGQRIQQSHRVAIMVLMVAVVGVLVASLAPRLGEPALAYVLLFPVVITSWVADRYLQQVDKVGWGGPTKALLWTLVLIAAAYVVIVQDPLVDLLMRQPLTWPLLVTLHWFLGTRLRMRVSEKLRFGPLKRLEEVVLNGGLSATVLTMNRRNRDYIARYNPPEVMGSLNKARAKALLLAEGVPVPDNFLLVSRKEEMAAALDAFLRVPRFAIKPADGYGGEGIVTVHGRWGDLFRTSSGYQRAEGLLQHLDAILDGEYNGGRPDEALLEALVETHPALQSIAPRGVPDVRVLCFRGYPVMAMLRLPTRESGGKGNLHVGAVGAGVEIATGRIPFAVWKGELVDRHPDTGAKLQGFVVPFWREILEIAAEAQRVSGLGYAGVDVVLDAEQGPLVLEVNRRPGLDIQKANGTGLLPRLRAVEAREAGEEATEVRVARAMEWDRHGWGDGSPSAETPQRVPTLEEVGFPSIAPDRGIYR